MKKEMTKTITSLLVFSILTIFAVDFVAAQNPILDPIVDLVTFRTDLSTSINIAKYLFWILLSALVWSILEASQIVKNNGIRWVISIIVAFLGVAYLAPNDIWGLLLSYNALGLTLLFLLPTAILFFFTLRIIKVGGSSGVVTQYLIWIIYFIFIIYRFIMSITENKLGYNQASTWIFLVAIGVSAVMVFGNRWIRMWLGKEFLTAQIEHAEKIERRAAALTRARARTVEEE